MNKTSSCSHEFPGCYSRFGNKREAEDSIVAMRSVTAVCSIIYKNSNHAIQQLVLLFIDAKKCKEVCPVEQKWKKSALKRFKLIVTF